MSDGLNDESRKQWPDRDNNHQLQSYFLKLYVDRTSSNQVKSVQNPSTNLPVKSE